LSSVPATKTEWELTPEAFDGLLSWLNPDRELAGRKYEEIRRKLITILSCRGCTCSEDLTDETLNRVARKVPEIIDNYVGNPALYFYGVAHKVHLEWLRRNGRALVPPPAPDPPEETEQEHECLEQCMEQLTSKSRELVSQYHREEKKAKIDGRKELADRLGIGVNALRIRAHRIRAGLQECVVLCLSKTRQNEMDTQRIDNRGT
jgi:DNA-directed RNA polymerase specialized sigma24 family protein